MTFMGSLRHVRFADAVFTRSALGSYRNALRLPRLPPSIEGADDSPRQQQRYQDEQRAQHKQPVGRERAGGEKGFCIIDEDSAQCRAGHLAATSAAAHTTPRALLSRPTTGTMLTPPAIH